MSEKIELKENTKRKSTAEEMHERIMSNRNKILEHFTQAYVAETGLRLDEIELIQEQRANNKIVWYFQKRKLIEEI